MLSPLLTNDECARLRSTVNVPALERLLAALPPDQRPPVFWACAVTLTAAEMERVGLGPVDGTVSAHDPLVLGRQDRPRYLPFARADFQLEFADAGLAALWAAVEPVAR